MTHYEVGKKYKKIVTVMKVKNEAPNILNIDGMNYVLDSRANRKAVKHGTREPGSCVRESTKLHK